ncbi:MAG: tyrosine recombinase [Bacteroidales bacterium]|nr:tyrosine recombinase [Bacteroidales bacterium]
MNWEQYINGFQSYIKLEKSQSANTFVAYLSDVRKFFDFMTANYSDISAKEVNQKHIEEFLKHINTSFNQSQDMTTLKVSSQNRLISALRSFFKYLITEDEIEDDPTSLIEPAKLPSKIPAVLTDYEIMQMLDICDKTTYKGYRDYVMIEVFYSTGLRVSELIGLKISDVFFEQEFIKVVGKGDKERIIPIGKIALHQLKVFIKGWRPSVSKKSNKRVPYVFLNQRGSKLTRQYVFMIIKDLAEKAGIKKNVHPHILRHSFATELVSRGANIMAVKDMMGHVNVRSTEIYTNFDTTTLRETLLLYHPLYNQEINT